jgi:hypothetical protein
MLKAACAWQDGIYNLTRCVKTIRIEINTEGKRWLPCSPMMAAGLTYRVSLDRWKKLSARIRPEIIL